MLGVEIINFEHWTLNIESAAVETSKSPQNGRWTLNVRSWMLDVKISALNIEHRTSNVQSTATETSESPKARVLGVECWKLNVENLNVERWTSKDLNLTSWILHPYQSTAAETSKVTVFPSVTTAFVSCSNEQSCVFLYGSWTLLWHDRSEIQFDKYVHSSPASIKIFMLIRIIENIQNRWIVSFLKGE